MLTKRLAVYANGYKEVTAGQTTAEIQRLLEAKKKREARMANYNRALADQKTYESEKKRFKAELERAQAINRKQETQLKELVSTHGKALLKPALEAPKVAMQVGKHDMQVPKQAEATVEKFKDEPALEETIDKVKEASLTEHDYQSSGWTAGRVARYALIASGISYLAYKLRSVTLQDITDLIMLFLAMK